MSGKPQNLRHVYKQLLRLAAQYPSRNRDKIYKGIQEEFRINADLVPDSPKLNRCIELAYQGIAQLRQFDTSVMSGGNEKDSPNWNVHMTKNPMPKPKSE